MTHINSTYIDVCTPKRVEKLSTYSSRLPLKIPVRVTKPGQLLYAMLIFILSQLVDGTYYITSLNETTILSLV